MTTEMKPNKLIALIDGSVYSQSVCDHAVWFAQKSDSAIDIVHVLGRREGSNEESNLSGSIGLGARTALLEELVELDAQKAKLSQKIGRAILDDAKSQMQESTTNEIHTKLRHGELIETVEELEQDAELIAIGKRGVAADFDKLHIGSNLERVARSSSKPVLVASRAFKPINRILIAFDGGDSVMKAIAFIAQSPVFKGVTCQVLTVGIDSVSTMEQLKSVSTILKNSGMTVERRVEEGQPETVIANILESEEFDLLVMGAYGHSRIRHLIIGSTTTEMIRSCKVPVLLFR